MSLKPLFSTYRQGENRVTASLLAVLSRLGTDLTELVTAIGYLLALRPLTAVVRRLEQTPLRPLVTGPARGDADRAPVTPG
jgi:hypothetical protein